MDKQIRVWRNELKYIVPMEQSILLQEDMQKIMIPDEHSRDGTYSVRSLYFDTINNKDLFEKDSGIQNRYKLRLRIYDLEDDFAKLEIKTKNNEYQNKSSLIISRNEVCGLIDGEYDFLLDKAMQAGDIALGLYAKLILGVYRPVVLIEYQRRAFVYDEYNTRVTFDSQIKFSQTDTDIYAKEPSWRNIFEDKCILEVKYNEKLFAPIRMVISKQNGMLTSFSKYANSRDLTAFM